MYTCIYVYTRDLPSISIDGDALADITFRCHCRKFGLFRYPEQDMLTWQVKGTWQVGALCKSGKPDRPWDTPEQWGLAGAGALCSTHFSHDLWETR